MTEADQDEPEDIEVRMTAALKRALATKPTPHKPKDRPDERKPAKG